MREPLEIDTVLHMQNKSQILNGRLAFTYKLFIDCYSGVSALRAPPLKGPLERAPLYLPALTLAPWNRVRQEKG